jgi:putative ABC transport system ATP-binding protein
MTAPLIEAQRVSRIFEAGRIQALREVTFAMDAGEFVAIQGPSGCGKSTLLNILGGLDRPTSGQVCFQATPLEQMGDLSAFRSRRVGFVFQASHLLPTLSPLENVEIPMFEMPFSRIERRQRATMLLEAVGLCDRMHERPAHLSGGERQRVAVARAIANDPRILLADEPTGNLDSEGASRIMELLREIRRQRNTALVVVTHDAGVASQADRQLTMLDGRVISDSGA